MKYEAGNRFNPDTYFKTEVDSTSVTVKVTGELEGVEVSFDSGDVPEITTLSVTENGTYEAPEGTAYDPVTVEVPNTYTESDEGKVVSSGALVSQTSTTKTANGTYDTTLNNEVVVEVPNTYTAADEGKVVSSGALVAQTSRTVTANDTYDTTTNNEVVVAVPVPSGSISITQNDTYDVTQYASAVVNVPSAGSYTLIHEQDLQVTTSSTSQTIELELTDNAFKSADQFFISIIDKAGPRAGYFYGCFSLFSNPESLNATPTVNTNLPKQTIFVDSNNKWIAYNTAYGIFPYSISVSDGKLVIDSRYSAQYSGTIDGTYHVAVYKLKLPNGSDSPFPVTP